MAWVKLDDGFFLHPKVLGLSKGAKLLYLSGLTYASAQLTDGRLTAAAVRMAARLVGVPPSLSSELGTSGLWEPSAEGFVIHDYHTYNPSKEKVLQAREAANRRVSEWRGKHRSNGVTSELRNADVTPTRASRVVPSHVPSRPHEAATTTEHPEQETDTGERHALAAPAAPRSPVRAVPKESQGVPKPHQAMIGALGKALGDPRTRGDWGKYATAAADLCRAGAEPDRVGWLVDRWGELFPGATCTPTALSNNYATLTGGQKPATNGRPRKETASEQAERIFAKHGVGVAS